MNATGQQLAVIDALGLSPDDLRDVANLIEGRQEVVLIRDIVLAYAAELPLHHRYEKSLNRLVEWAGEHDASTVTGEDIDGWAQQAGAEARALRGSRHGISAHETFVLAARGAFAKAIRSGLVRANPARQAQLPERPPSRRTALSCDQLRNLHLSLVAISRDPELDDLIFQLLRETACRRHGPVGLSRHDLAPANQALKVVEKYGKERWVPASAHLLRRLTTHAEARHPQCDLVLHRRDGSHLTDRWFGGFARRIQQAVWAAELGVTAHWIRHTTLTDIERLAGVRVAAAYAGHSDNTFGVTGTYTKVSLDELRLAHDRLFFDNVEDPSMTPQLFRRVLPEGLSHPNFATG